MGIFDQLGQFKAAQEALKGMSPEQVQQLMSQAGSMQKIMEETVRKAVEEEIKKRNLIDKDEVERMFYERGL